MESVHAQDIPQAKRLNTHIAQGKAALFFYGETGLLACRGLALDAIVHAAPQGYYARALTNQFDAERACVVFVPSGMDATQWTPLRERSRLIMYYVGKHDFPYGMMVTASYNPSLYNGIKVFTAGERDADEVQTGDIEAYIGPLRYGNHPPGA